MSPETTTLYNNTRAVIDQILAAREPKVDYDFSRLKPQYIYSCITVMLDQLVEEFDEHGVINVESTTSIITCDKNVFAVGMQDYTEEANIFDVLAAAIRDYKQDMDNINPVQVYFS